MTTRPRGEVRGRWGRASHVRARRNCHPTLFRVETVSTRSLRALAGLGVWRREGITRCVPKIFRFSSRETTARDRSPPRAALRMASSRVGLWVTFARVSPRSTRGNARARTVVRGASSSSPGGEMRRKLRILCLHSFRTSGEILREQVRLAGWEETLGDLVEFHVMDAPHQRADPYPPTSSPSSPTCPTASGGTPPSAPTRTRPGERR